MKTRAGTAASAILGKLVPLHWKDEDGGTDEALAEAGGPTRCLGSPRARAEAEAQMSPSLHWAGCVFMGPGSPCPPAEPPTPVPDPSVAEEHPQAGMHREGVLSRAVERVLSKFR